MHELQYRNEGHRRLVERNDPNAEDLRDVDIEKERRLVISNGIDGDIYPWAHNLVPSVDTLNQESRIVKASCAAKWVCERRIRREVRLDCLSLLRWRRLSQAMYHAGDFFHCIDEIKPLVYRFPTFTM